MKKRVIHSFVVAFFSVVAAAQVPVREEPRHKTALQNDYIRLLDVRIQPGDTSLFHIHQIPSFFIPLSTTSIGSEVMGQAPRQTRFPLDSTWYNGFENGPLIHRVWNSDTNVLHVIDLELLATKNSTLSNSVQLPFKIDFENEKLRVYKCQLAGGQILAIPLLQTPMLVVSMSGEGLAVKDLDKNSLIDILPGGFRWLDPQQRVVIGNHGNISTRSILILFK